MKTGILIGLISLLVLTCLPVTTGADFKVDFVFTDTNNEVRSIDEFSGKPILIEWGASWCSTCKQNQENMKKIYNDYKDRVTFISISIQLSGDTIEDVKDMKQEGPYDWLFGLEEVEYTLSLGVSNGYNWLVDENLNLVKTWNRTVVSSYDFAQSFEDNFGIENTLEDTELLVGDPSILITMSTMFVMLTIFVKRRTT